jgi:hypothetical protein
MKLGQNEKIKESLEEELLNNAKEMDLVKKM